MELIKAKRNSNLKIFCCCCFATDRSRSNQWFVSKNLQRKQSRDSTRDEQIVYWVGRNCAEYKLERSETAKGRSQATRWNRIQIMGKVDELDGFIWVRKRNSIKKQQNTFLFHFVYSISFQTIFVFRFVYNINLRIDRNI